MMATRKQRPPKQRPPIPIAIAAPKPRLVDHLTRALAADLMASARAEDGAKLVHWRTHPVEWCVEELRIAEPTLRWSRNTGYDGHQWDGTPDPIAALLEGVVQHRRIGVEAGVATQKTYTLALLVLWFLTCWRDSVVVTFAPKKDQLKKHLWREITGLWWPFQLLHPRAVLDDLRIRMAAGSDRWTAYGFSVGVGAEEVSAVRAQGAHAEHMLFIVEETPGVHPAILTALLNTAVGAHNVIVAVGNPDHQLDPLHRFCTVVGTRAIRISAMDHPNVVLRRIVVPGAVTADSITDKAARYGGEQAPLYRSRVRGLAPAERTDALIRLEWCYAARDRGRSLMAEREVAPLVRLLQSRRPADGEIALGVDVANSSDGDRGAIARGLGAILLEVESFPCPDANVLGQRIAAEIRSRSITPARVGVDGVGVGAGTVNELKRQDYGVQNLIGGAEATQTGLLAEERCRNLRAQMWWLLRLDLQHGRVILPDDEELFQDLTALTWETRGGYIVVESKEAIRARLGRSPDKGDAAVYWNWVRQASDVGGGSVSVAL